MRSRRWGRRSTSAESTMTASRWPRSPSPRAGSGARPSAARWCPAPSTRSPSSPSPPPAPRDRRRSGTRPSSGSRNRTASTALPSSSGRWASPSRSGGTASGRLAGRLGYTYVNSGAIYRAVAWRVQGGARLPDVLRTARVEFRGDPRGLRVLVDGADATEGLYTPEVSVLAARLSREPAVRAYADALQRAHAEHG